MEKHFELFGLKVRDAVTGFEGVVTTISFDLYGCVQAIVTPELDKKAAGDSERSRWFDTKRLVALSKKPVMALPTFENVPGGADKPAMASRPFKKA